MKKTNVVIIAIVVGLICLGVGYGVGLSSAKKAMKGAMEGAKIETPTATPLADLLSSKVIKGLTTTATGEVSAISGRNLTLGNDGDTLTISIRGDAPIYQIIPPAEEATLVPQPVTRKEIKFEEIKVGDKVNISSELKADGSLEGIDVAVLS